MDTYKTGYRGLIDIQPVKPVETTRDPELYNFIEIGLKVEFRNECRIFIWLASSF